MEGWGWGLEGWGWELEDGGCRAGGRGWRDGCCLLSQRTWFLSPAPHSPSPCSPVPRTLMLPSKGTEHTCGTHIQGKHPHTPIQVFFFFFFKA